MTSYLGDEEFMVELGLDHHAQGELMSLLESRDARDSLEALLEEPFRRKSRLDKTGFGVSRYSDGSFQVFYCSTEADTARAEARHNRSRYVGDLPTRYMCFTCDFEGFTKDLRPKRAVWPSLTHHCDYGFCNKLGTEAVQERLDGLLAPSVRRVGGTTVPVFTRSAISNARDLEEVRDL